MYSLSLISSFVGLRAFSLAFAAARCAAPIAALTLSTTSTLSSAARNGLCASAAVLLGTMIPLSPSSSSACARFLLGEGEGDHAILMSSSLGRRGMVDGGFHGKNFSSGNLQL